ncbi:MAG: hypothetical protein P8181_13245 [bacterium]
MKDEHQDIEETLKNFRHIPGPSVKRSVLSRFAARPAAGRKLNVWRRPVPLYAVAAQTVIALGLGLLAARWLPLPNSESDLRRGTHGSVEMRWESGDVENAVSPDSLKWETAQNDII